MFKVYEHYEHLDLSHFYEVQLGVRNGNNSYYFVLLLSKMWMLTCKTEMMERILKR